MLVPLLCNVLVFRERTEPARVKVISILHFHHIQPFMVIIKFRFLRRIVQMKRISIRVWGKQSWIDTVYARLADLA